MLRRVTIAGVWLGLIGLLGLLAWGVFRVSAADTINAAVGGPTRVNKKASNKRIIRRRRGRRYGIRKLIK